MQNKEFEFKPSRVYIGLQAVILLAGVGMIALLPIVLIARSLLQAIMIVYILYIVRRHGFLRAPDSVRIMSKLDSKRWQITTNTRRFDGHLLGESAISRWVSVLRFTVGGQSAPYVCIIWYDSLPQDEYRQLVVSLSS